MRSAGVQLGGRYRLDSRIGGGGMGEVWLATDEVLGRRVAVKVMLPALLDEPGFAERFRSEARMMAQLTHPGVVDVYDYGDDDTAAYLVMEYVDADPLSRTLQQAGRLTAVRTLALVAQAADALEAAHVAGVVHRDVKPGNLLVRADGTLVLTDFGIARSDQNTQLTSAGAVLGTASYISPEQASGEVATPRSDIYSLGVVAYQCLAGRRPFEGGHPFEIAMKHVREPVPSLPADVPAPAVELVQRALAKNPGDRWPTAADTAAAARAAAAALSAPAGHATAAAQAAGGHAPGGHATTPHAVASHAAAPPAHPTAPLPGTEPTRGTSPLTVVLVILLALATVACAGLGGYAVRQATGGDGLTGEFSAMVAYDISLKDR